MAAERGKAMFGLGSPKGVRSKVGDCSHSLSCLSFLLVLLAPHVVCVDVRGARRVHVWCKVLGREPRQTSF